jgi:hypothetical protein
MVLFSFLGSRLLIYREEEGSGHEMSATTVCGKSPTGEDGLSSHRHVCVLGAQKLLGGVIVRHARPPTSLVSHGHQSFVWVSSSYFTFAFFVPVSQSYHILLASIQSAPFHLGMGVGSGILACVRAAQIGPPVAFCGLPTRHGYTPVVI